MGYLPCEMIPQAVTPRGQNLGSGLLKRAMLRANELRTATGEYDPDCGGGSRGAQPQL
jgi:hypothetical protein